MVEIEDNFAQRVEGRFFMKDVNKNNYLTNSHLKRTINPIWLRTIPSIIEYDWR